VSGEARGRGVPTPRVLAAIVHPARPGYRSEVATSWLTPGHDLSALLKPGVYDETERGAALKAVGETIVNAARAGLQHADLNLSNIFVGPATDGGWRALILDLDRARIQAPDTLPVEPGVDRLLRSIEKARRGGRAEWTGADAEALDAGIHHSR